MGIKKSIAAVVLAASMMLGSLSASAATSPSKPAEATTYVDKNTKDHKNSTVVSNVNKKGTAATVTKAYANNTKSGSNGVVISTARNAKGKKVPVTYFGNGKTGVFATKKGNKVTKVNFQSKKTVVIKAQAFAKSKVNTVRVKGKVSIKKNAFKDTKVKNATIRSYVKKASSVTAAKGAFTGLSKSAKVIVSKKSMSKAEFKKLSKKLKKAGFKGTIVRK